MIHVDLDGTLFDSTPVFLSYVAARLEVPTPEGEPGDYSGLPALFPPHLREQAKHLVNLAVLEPLCYAGMAPYPGAIEVLRAWEGQGLLGHYVTHRPQATHEATLEAIERWGLPMRAIRYLEDKTLAAAEPGFRLHIDDSPSVIQRFQAAGLPLLIFDQPYNRHLGGPRARDWHAIQRYVEGI